MTRFYVGFGVLVICSCFDVDVDNKESSLVRDSREGVDYVCSTPFEHLGEYHELENILAADKMGN